MNIPEVLKKECRFVCHDKAKRPINPLTGSFAKVTDSGTWTSFEEAVACIGKFGSLGIGFVLGGGFVGIDMDTCIDMETSQISDEALEVLETLDSYTEISVSGTGLHTIIKAEGLNLPFNKRKMQTNGIIRPDIDLITGKQKLDKNGDPKFKNPEIELYDKNRYFILTGNIYGGYNQVNERTEKLKGIISKYDNSTVSNINSKASTELQTSIEEALKLDKVFNSYWNGNRPNKDESADDLALMGKPLLVQCRCGFGN